MRARESGLCRSIAALLMISVCMVGCVSSQSPVSLDAVDVQASRLQEIEKDYEKLFGQIGKDRAVGKLSETQVDVLVELGGPVQTKITDAWGALARARMGQMDVAVAKQSVDEAKTALDSLYLYFRQLRPEEKGEM